MGGRIFKLTVSISIVLLLIFPHAVHAGTPLAQIVINELQTNGVGTGTTGQEFIELKNISTAAVDISGWKLQYISSTGNLATAKYFVTFPTSTVIYPGGFLLITPDTYLPDSAPKITYEINSSFSGMASTGATVRLVDAINVVVDTVGWGTKITTLSESELALAPADGMSIQRKVVDGQTVDSDNNKNDFESLTTPTPQTENPTPIADTPPDDEEDTPPVPDESQPEDTTQPEDTPSIEEPATIPTETTADTPAVPTEQPILLNELFIDPISPLTDANDEWVELYNPGTTDQDLVGYTVYAGETYSYHHTFANGVIVPAGGYVVITSKDTSIALSNSGGKVKVVSPSGAIYDETSYQTAEAGEAWAKDSSGVWLWTTTPTQGSINIITTSIPIAVVAKAAATAKKASTKAATTTAKTTAAKTTKVKAAATTQDEQETLVPAPTPLPLWLLALLGVLAVLYSGYEYRFDIANKVYQLKNTEQLGQQLGANLKGGEVIELISDLGGGKTTLVRGIASGAGSTDDVASPTFTISRVYIAPQFSIYHFDFYRLTEPGIIAHELAEVNNDNQAVTIVEWGNIMNSVLPVNRLRIEINQGERVDERDIQLTVPKERAYLTEGLTS